MPNPWNLPGKLRCCLLQKGFQTWPLLGYFTSGWPWLPSSHAAAGICSCFPHRWWAGGQELGLDCCHWPPSLHSAPVPGTTKAAEHRWKTESSWPLEPREGQCGYWSFCTLRWNTVPNRNEKLYLLGSGWGCWEANNTTYTYPVPMKNQATQEQVAKPRIIQPIYLCHTDLTIPDSDALQKDKLRMHISLPEKITKVWLKADFGRGKVF